MVVEWKKLIIVWVREVVVLRDCKFVFGFEWVFVGWCKFLLWEFEVEWVNEFDVWVCVVVKVNDFVVVFVVKVCSLMSEWVWCVSVCCRESKWVCCVSGWELEGVVVVMLVEVEGDDVVVWVFIVVWVIVNSKCVSVCCNCVGMYVVVWVNRVCWESVWWLRRWWVWLLCKCCVSIVRLLRD